jgi:hypothetical protein
MGLRSAPGVPHKGWTLVDVIDARDDEGIDFDEYESCEYCDHESIRFVHVLSHPEYAGPMRVGCVCSCHLTQDYVNPKRREREVRNLAAKRKRFVTKKWDWNRFGGETKELDGYRVTVSRKKEGFRLWINGKEGSRFYSEASDAKAAAFDAVRKFEAKRINAAFQPAIIDRRP